MGSSLHLCRTPSGWPKERPLYKDPHGGMSVGLDSGRDGGFGDLLEMGTHSDSPCGLSPEEITKRVDSWAWALEPRSFLPEGSRHLKLRKDSAAAPKGRQRWDGVRSWGNGGPSPRVPAGARTTAVLVFRERTVDPAARLRTPLPALGALMVCVHVQGDASAPHTAGLCSLAAPSLANAAAARRAGRCRARRASGAQAPRALPRRLPRGWRLAPRVCHMGAAWRALGAVCGWTATGRCSGTGHGPAGVIWRHPCARSRSGLSGRWLLEA